jgi:predicted nucleic acid-binding protein
MTKFVVDAGAVIHLASEHLEVFVGHELLAPTLLRSQTLSLLHEEVRQGDLSAEPALDRLEDIWRLKIRLLGDAVLRRRAWKVADELGWADTYTAEYIALTQLQADAFVTMDPKLADEVEGVVTAATIDDLLRE